MSPRTLQRHLLPHYSESFASSSKSFLVGVLLAVLALSLWLAALGSTSLDVNSKASPNPVSALSASATFWDAPAHVGTPAAPDERVAEPTENRLADLPGADMEGSDVERFPARNLLPQNFRGYGWLYSAARIADLGRVNTLLRPPDA